jgi:hypothetical protein
MTMGQSWILHQIRMILPSAPQAAVQWQQGWWASDGKGDKEGNGDGNRGGKQQ